MSSSEYLAKLLAERSYRTAQPGESFLLASGRRSSFYFDCKATTFHAEALPLLGRALLDEVRRASTHPHAAGGLTQGADPLALALARASCDDPPQIDAFSVRKQRKEHGLSHWIEGCAKRGVRVVVLDDVVTTGGSTVVAIERCREEGLLVVQVVALVDREEGGLERIRSAVPDVPVSALFTRRQIEAAR